MQTFNQLMKSPRAIFFGEYAPGRKAFFWMQKKDAEFRNAEMGGGYEFIANGKKIGNIVTASDGKKYQFFSDYSLKPL